MKFFEFSGIMVDVTTLRSVTKPFSIDIGFFRSDIRWRILAIPHQTEPVGSDYFRTYIGEYCSEEEADFQFKNLMRLLEGV